MAPVRIDGRAFEDVLDGYFELRDAAAQMLARRGLASAVIELDHAPFMLLDLPRAAPVPLRLGAAPAGVLVRAVLTVRREGARLGGVARWHMEGGPDRLPLSLRLAEPAALSGLGFAPGAVDAGPLGRVAGPGGLALAAPEPGAPGRPVCAPGPIMPLGSPAAALLRGARTL